MNKKVWAKERISTYNPPHLMRNLFNSLSHWISQYPKSILIASFLLATWGTVYTAKLYGNLKTDLAELLPRDSRSVKDIDRVKERLEASDDLSVLIFSDKPAASKKLIELFVEKLKSQHSDKIARVEYNISRELDFFKSRRTLYLELEDLNRISVYIHDKIKYERILRDPLTIFNGVSMIEPRLDLKGMEKKYSKKTSAYEKFPDGFYATPDEKIRVALIYSKNSKDPKKKLNPKTLKVAVEETLNSLDPKSFDSNIKIAYSGGVQNTIEEQEALMADLALSTGLVALIVWALMILYFGTVLSAGVVILTLFVGTLGTFGISYFIVGSLNANSAFLGSIVMGNGINFPIIFMARYLEERRMGHIHSESLTNSFAHTAESTWTAAMAAGLAYGSLVMTSFRGFKQFGVIGFIGMFVCWVTTFTVLPSLVTLFQDSPAFRKPTTAVFNWIAGFFSKTIQNFPRAIVFFSVAITIVSILSFSKYDPTILETNLKNLRNKVSLESGSGFYAKYVDQIFQRYLTPVVVLAPSLESARAISQDLKKKQREDVNGSLLANVQILEDFIPNKQNEKISVLMDVSRTLSSSIRDRLGPKEKKLVENFLTPNAMRPFSLDSLPELVKSKFREQDGSFGKLVLVEPPLGSSTWKSDALVNFVSLVRDSADRFGNQAPVAGALPLTTDMLASISKDGPKATLVAFLAVVMLVVLQFRRWRDYSPVILALLLGVLWMIGFMLLYWFKVNFLNFIALPITFGIGVDYAVNVFQRYKEVGGREMDKVIRDTGGAVFLCSLTTIVGWGSLLIADNQAFVSFGTLAVIGELTCVFAALFTLPSLLILWERRNRSS